MSTLVGIVLAAGGGSRMGTAKQLLRVGLLLPLKCP